MTFGYLMLFILFTIILTQRALFGATIKELKRVHREELHEEFMLGWKTGWDTGTEESERKRKFTK